MMSLKMYELKKAFTSPVVLGLMVLFVGFNFFVIYNHAYIKEELSIVNQLVNKFGYEIDDPMMDDFEADYQSQLKEMNEITNQKVSKTYESASAFYDAFPYEKKDLFSRKELDFIAGIMVMEKYYNSAGGIDSYYERVDVMAVAESEIRMYGISGQAAETVREQFRTLSARLDQLIKNGEHKTLFINSTHTILFKNLFKTVIFEVMILVVLITGYLLAFEFENNTQLMVYSSKRGRKLDIDKLFASIFASLIVTTVILGITLAGYFIVFKYAEIWHVPISSYFNKEFKFPYISWWKMSFTTYLICSIILLYLCQIIFSVMTFIVTNFIRNSYIVFLLFGVLFGVGVLLPGYIPMNTDLIFLAHMTPFSIILNPHLWFMGWSAFTSKYYELYTIILWVVILSVLCGFTIRKFKKQNIN